jgi:predicted DNA-binding ribbon-helix-helix protein
MLIKRSFSLADRRTSVALEQEFWAALMHVAVKRQQRLTALVAEGDARQRHCGCARSRSSSHGPQS